MSFVAVKCSDIYLHVRYEGLPFFYEKIEKLLGQIKELLSGSDQGGSTSLCSPISSSRVPVGGAV